jgi:hypothetical protein
MEQNGVKMLDISGNVGSSKWKPTRMKWVLVFALIQEGV